MKYCEGCRCGTPFLVLKTGKAEKQRGKPSANESKNAQVGLFVLFLSAQLGGSLPIKTCF